MAIQVEIWQRTIKEQMRKNNQFLEFMRNADEYVIGGKSVHIPQSGAASAVVKNRVTLPATISKRTDTIITYSLNEYTTDPVLIPNADIVELSYDKRNSVVRENTAEIMQYVGDDIAYLLYANINTGTAGIKLPTTGAARLASAPGATGNRKRILEADIRQAAIELDKQNVPREGRYMGLPPDMLNDLMSDKDLLYAFSNPINIREGVVGKLFGFNLVPRAHYLAISAALAPKDPTAATAATDHNSAIFWHQDTMERAFGDIMMYDNYGRAEYYGDIYSFLVRASGRNNRQDNKGYGLIYEDVSA